MINGAIQYKHLSKFKELIYSRHLLHVDSRTYKMVFGYNSHFKGTKLCRAELHLGDIYFD